MRLSGLVLRSILVLVPACGDNTAAPPVPSTEGGVEVPDVLTFDPKKVTGQAGADPGKEDPDDDPSGGRDAGGRADAGDGDGDGDGPSPVTYSCKGVPDSCSLMTSSATCGGLLGCSWKSACSGTPKSCNNQISQFTCVPIDGCIWYGSGGYCAGTPRACSLAIGPNTCSSQGCQWKETCEGTSSGCALMVTESTCEAQGCQWERD